MLWMAGLLAQAKKHEKGSKRYVYIAKHLGIVLGRARAQSPYVVELIFLFYYADCD